MKKRKGEERCQQGSKEREKKSERRNDRGLSNKSPLPAKLILLNMWLAPSTAYQVSMSDEALTVMGRMWTQNSPCFHPHPPFELLSLIA